MYVLLVEDFAATEAVDLTRMTAARAGVHPNCKPSARGAAAPLEASRQASSSHAQSARTITLGSRRQPAHSRRDDGTAAGEREVVSRAPRSYPGCVESASAAATTRAQTAAQASPNRSQRARPPERRARRVGRAAQLASVTAGEAQNAPERPGGPRDIAADRRPASPSETETSPDAIGSA